MNRKIVFYVVFFFALVALFLFGLTRVIPGFAEVKLPVISYVHPFHFTDQNGRSITQEETKGKVYVAEFFFTTCKGICPKLNNNLKKIYAEFPQEENLVFLSHTVDPETDSVPRLKIYADSMGIDNDRWHLVTGTKDSLYYAARASYLLDDPKNNSSSIEEQFLHTQLFALVDKSGRVRKIYDGLKAVELADLKKDIQNLLKES